jgi:galactokinase/mevalonate kinase-like predicted kinase
VRTDGPGRGFAYARAALAGNPSDGYGGAVLAVTLPWWRASAEAQPAPDALADPANALVEATVRRFAREHETGAAAVSWATEIPQRVGLGSSSALVIAILRALCELHAVELDPAELAELALAVETEDLGIVAGLQDRVVQAYGGLVFMDFYAAGGGRRYELLDDSLLPPLLIAWQAEAAATSGEVHGDLRARHRRGEAHVHDAMRELASSAARAREALVARDAERFAGCVDRTFDLRAELLDLDPRCVEMVNAARGAGAAANYTGSGGAIVAVCRDARHAGRVADALQALGCEVTQYPYAG